MSHKGESLVESVFVLALVTVIAISVLVGIGQRSAQRLSNVNEALGGAPIETRILHESVSPATNSPPQGVTSP
jgi:hypothetical protein